MASESPKSIKAYREQRVLEVGWNDGSVQRIAFKTLRSLCPCAGCVDELTGVRTLDIDAIPADIAPSQIELCGNYVPARRVERRTFDRSLYLAAPRGDRRRPVLKPSTGANRTP